jgi:L-seryl-tRNA(Ser) seleniumtransferase
MKKTNLKDLPSVNKVLIELNDSVSVHDDFLKTLINRAINKYRNKIKNNELSMGPSELLSNITEMVIKDSSRSLVNIINGTGIVLHTGFGRAPFDSKLLKSIAKRLDGYVNLEFDLESGKRGDRQSHVRDHLSSICGSESSLCVNNNAASVMLSINEMAFGGEVIVSRGQLVEIGGSFRIPDIIKKSGAVLREVGTTNRTHFSDYKKAVSKKTKLILWVHTSNYVVKGFTRSVPLSDLVQLGRSKNIPVMVDWGSGAILDMKSLGLANEMPIRTIMSDKPDILTFSGDKLIGGPQSGIIIGKEKWINAMQKNPLYRVMRSDKITLGLLEEILRSYRSNYFTKDNLSLRMLTTKRSTLVNRGKKVIQGLTKKKIKDFNIVLENSKVEAGSGSLPENPIESIALSFSHKNISPNGLARKFRSGRIPVVGYIKSNKFIIDLKAILPNQLLKLKTAIKEI